MDKVIVRKKESKSFLRNAIQLIPNLLQLLNRLLKDPRVHRNDKLLLLGAIAYVIMPFDLIPDFIPFFGEIDDIYFVAIALIRLMHHADETVLRDNWSGPGDVVTLVERISNFAVFFLPKRVREVLVGMSQHR